MKPADIVHKILEEYPLGEIQEEGYGFAPANIALCKYWGKRDTVLNLPVTSSLSITLGEEGTFTKVTFSQDMQDHMQVNGEDLALDTSFAERLVRFLDLFRPKNRYFSVVTRTTIPVGVGLASSAAGYAALVKALNQLFDWQLKDEYLSILARMGSGSACRSLWRGFVKWHVGARADGMDSYAEPLPYTWPDLCIGVLLFSKALKSISSRDAMQRTVKTSTLYQSWPSQVAQDLPRLEQAIAERDFTLLGKTAEANALAMHATMLSSWPPIYYTLPETLEAMRHIWRLRSQGLPLYFTQDAGPNLKLLFLASNTDAVTKAFPEVSFVAPF